MVPAGGSGASRIVTSLERRRAVRFEMLSNEMSFARVMILMICSGMTFDSESVSSFIVTSSSSWVAVSSACTVDPRNSFSANCRFDMNLFHALSFEKSDRRSNPSSSHSVTSSRGSLSVS